MVVIVVVFNRMNWGGVGSGVKKNGGAGGGGGAVQ